MNLLPEPSTAASSPRPFPEIPATSDILWTDTSVSEVKNWIKDITATRDTVTSLPKRSIGSDISLRRGHAWTQHPLTV